MPKVWLAVDVASDLHAAFLSSADGSMRLF